MAWVKEVDDSEFLVVDDWGPAGTKYSDCYAKATLHIRTSEDTVYYTINMYTEVDGKHNDKPGVSIYLSIDDQVGKKETDDFINKYWVYSETSSKWNHFPTKNGSYFSGSFVTKTKNDASIPVVLKIATTQNGYSYPTVWKSDSKNIERTWYTKGTAPTIILRDNKDNTVTASGALGKNGDNNTLQSAYLYYTTDGSDPSKSNSRKSFDLGNTSGGSYSKKITISKTCKIKAYVECKFAHNTTSASASSTADVIYYEKPSNPGKPKLSYKKSRLTVKEPWTFTWDAARTNSDYTEFGYWARLYRKPNGSGTWEDGHVLGMSLSKKTEDSFIVKKGSNNNNDAIRWEAANNNKSKSLVIEDPASFGFLPGDKMTFAIRAYIKNGKSDILESDHIVADTYTIQNAGIVNVKVENGWKEGQVYVKVNGGWKEAETVNVKTSGGWEESQ
jgi:hypothetical protein